MFFETSHGYVYSMLITSMLGFDHEEDFHPWFISCRNRVSSVSDSADSFRAHGAFARERFRGILSIRAGFQSRSVAGSEGGGLCEKRSP
jgi:hypothetical protein